MLAANFARVRGLVGFLVGPYVREQGVFLEETGAASIAREGTEVLYHVFLQHVEVGESAGAFRALEVVQRQTEL